MRKQNILAAFASVFLLLAGCQEENMAEQSSPVSKEEPSAASSAVSLEEPAVKPNMQNRFESIGDWSGEKALEVGFSNGKNLADNTLVFQAQHGLDLELIVIDPKNGQVLADKDFGTSFISVYGNNIAVREERRAILINARLEELKSVGIPSELDIWNYNISDDFTKLSYADEEGVNLYDVVTDQNKLLNRHPNAEAPNSVDTELYKGTFFVDNGKQLLARKIHYEHASGYTLFHLSNNKQTEINLPLKPGEQEFVLEKMICTVDIMESGLSIVNVCTYQEPEKIKSYELKGIKKGDPVAVNEQYLYYFSENQLQQLDLSDGNIRNVTLQYQLNTPVMMGVTANNTVLFIDEGNWYSIRL